LRFFDVKSADKALIGTVILMLTATACQAQSLWDNRRPEHAFLFHDTQARRVGDLLTVLVNENTDVTNQDKRSLKKETDAGSNFSLSHSATGIFGNSAGALGENFGLDSERDFSGNSAFASERQFSDRITVAVMDVLPNGNLVIGGRRRVAVEGDNRILVISGLVRLVDVRPDNTIQSRYIDQLDISYEGKGVESRFVNQGWLGRVTNRIWPF